MNYIVNPTGKNISHYSLPIPKDHILVGNNINERLLKKQMLEVESNVTTFVIGSSRVMYGFDSMFFDGKENVLNLGVSNGSFFDYRFFINQLLHKKNIHHVYIEIAPWTFPSIGVRGNMFSELSCALQNSNSCKSSGTYLRDLFTFSFTKESYKMVFGKRAGEIIPLKESENISGYTFDGRHHSEIKYLNTDLYTSNERVMRQISEKNITDFETEIDQAQMKELCMLSRDLSREVPSIIFFILPFNPIASKLLRDRNLGYTIESKVQDVKSKFEQTCNKNLLFPGVKVQEVGKNCQPEEFFDGEHFKESCFAKIKKELIRG